ncbi:MAG: TlpA family protein disulfide reductase [Bacteroidales bacterium]|nr:TlpA family protein disulfide reductase [Bacteroidales bacterium]
MKTTALILIISLLIISCSDEDKTVTFTGEIINPTEEMVWITINDSTQLSSKLDTNNKFTFELNITEANKYRFDHGGHTFIFLKPGSSLHLTLDTEDFDGAITYSGTDVEENKYLKKRILIAQGLQADRFNIPNLYESEFDSLITNTLGVWKKSLLELKNIEKGQYTRFKEDELKELTKISTIASDYYKSMKKLTPGNEAIDFRIEDIHGKEYTLKDFKDNVICIDVWASWCSACLKEMPYLEKLENKFKNHDIKFIVVSIDDGEDVWKKLLKERNMHGNQYWAKRGQKSDFYMNYQLRDLPVCIIIDKEGKIVKSRAPRPSENLEEIIIEALNI